jgi:PAS domain S-box-containing protein
MTVYILLEVALTAKTDQTLEHRWQKLSHYSIERAADMVIWFSSEGRIIRANETTVKVTGYAATELKQMHIYDLNPTFTKKDWPEHWQRLKEKGVFTRETLIETKAGQQISVEVKNNLIEFENQEYSVSFIRDITERKIANDRLREALMEVETLKNQLQAENVYLQSEIKQNHNFEKIIGKSEPIRLALEKVTLVAGTDATVLILGETGTGKELFARAVHHFSKRQRRPLIKVDCATLPASLIESELFGHEKGAFTGALEQRLGRFELADGGTIFLDEIGDLPLELQGKLLRVLQDSEFERLGGSRPIPVDVRVIAATNRDLESAVKSGKFRQDLYFRLNVFPILLPPLRGRQEDIPHLIEQFKIKHSQRINKPIHTISKSFLNALKAYHWPGNVRELEHIIERAIILSQNGVLEGSELPLVSDSVAEVHELPTLDEAQRRHILKTLKLTHWRVSGEKGAARLLGMKSPTLVARMKKLGIRRPV